MTASHRIVPLPLVLIGLAALCAALVLSPRVVQAQPPNNSERTAPIWSADMLVVEYTSVSIGAASPDLFSNVGGTGNLQVKSLWSYLPTGDLRLAFTDGVPDAADMTLTVGDLELEFPAGSSGEGSFKWTGVDVDWKDGDTIAVSIVRTSTLTEPEGNTQATGGPTITGTPQVDQTLTADTSSISDEDGLEAVSYEYQWIRSDNGTDTDIAGATEASYALVFADQGKTIKVKVKFTDDAENEETLTSEATGIVKAASNRGATGDPTISGTPQVNQVLTAGTAAISDEDGLDGVSYEYQWMAGETDIEDATEATYTPSTEDVGTTIKVKVSFTDDRNNAETLTSAATVAVVAAPNREATGQPTIDGTPQVGETLTANTANVADQDGLTNVSYSYQWTRSDIGTDADIAGQTDPTYTLVAADQGKTIKVRVSFTDDADNEETLTSAATVQVAAAPSAPAIGSLTPSNQAVTVIWAAPASNGGPAITSYDLRYIRSDTTDKADSNWTVVSAIWTSGLLEYTLNPTNPQLVNGVSYDVQVRAVEGTNQHAWSGTRSATPLTTPGAPAIDSVSPGDRSLTVKWIAPTSDGGAQVTAFDARYIRSEATDKSDDQWTVVEDAWTSASGTLEYTVIGLTTDVQYDVQMRAVNAGGDGLWSTTETGKPQTPPSVPQDLEVYLYGTTNLEARWSAPASETITAFKVQWRSGSEEWDSSRTDTVSPTPAHVRWSSTDASWRYRHVLDGLTDDTEYQIRVIAVNDGTDSPPSPVVTAMPKALFTGGDAADFVRTEVVGLYETEYPWLRTAFNHISGAIEFRSIRGDGIRTTPALNHNGLDYIQVGGMFIRRVTDDTLIPQIIHELAHVYTMSNQLPAHPAPIAVAWIYFDGLSNYLEHPFWLTCYTGFELMADVMVMEMLGTDVTTDYWPKCTAPTEEALASAETEALEVVRSMMAGEMPLWFADTYHDPEGNPELERLWSDVKAISRWSPEDRRAGEPRVVYQLRNEFGGYCSHAAAVNGLPERSATRNPWRDGGCVPQAPPSLEAVAAVDATITVSWQSPGDDGGSAITGYRVLWKSGAQDFGASREAVVTDLADLSYKLADLTHGVEYTIRVVAKNFNGDGAVAEVTKATPQTLNSPATGVVAINGIPQVAVTLKADVSGIADQDGLASVSYSYQWIRSDSGTDTDIAGETDSTYTLVATDMGKTIKVRVSFNDDAENQETLTSEATVAVAAAVPTAPLSLAVTPGDQSQELHASWQAPSSNGGSDVTGYKVQWKESTDSWDTEADVSEATVTGTSHTITSLTGGVEYRVRVSALNDVGTGPASAEASGTPQQAALWSATLTVGTTETFAGYSTFLMSSETNILGALSADTFTSDGASHTVKALGVLDGELLLTVTPRPSFGFVLTAGTTEFASTDAAIRESGSLVQFLWTGSGPDWSDGEEVAVRLTRTTGLPAISGTPRVDETLTADTSAITDEDGLTSPTFAYQWIAGGTDIAGASGSSYELTSSEQGKTIQVRVTFTDDAENEETLTSLATVAVEAAATNPLTGFTVVDATTAPQTVLGTLADGGTLPLDDPAGGSYGIRVDVEQGVAIGSVRLRLTGGKSVDQTEHHAPYSLYGDGGAGALNGQPLPAGSYTLTATAYSEGGLGGDLLGTLTVSFTVEAANSAPTGLPSISDNPQVEQSKVEQSKGVPEQVVEPANSAPTGLPGISGTPRVDVTLTADTSSIDDADGLSNVSYEYQWIAGGSDIGGATASTYTLTAGEQGKTIQVRVTFTDDADNEETLTSIATAAVAAAPVPLTVSVTVSAPASHDGSSEFTFEIEFSEEFGLSYRILRDDAFNVTGGSVESAQRTDKPSNIPWLITVKPQGNGDVTIELPATTDCDADGAICTGDGRKLSNPLSFTVTGPGQ